MACRSQPSSVGSARSEEAWTPPSRRAMLHLVAGLATTLALRAVPPPLSPPLLQRGALTLLVPPHHVHRAATATAAVLPPPPEARPVAQPHPSTLPLGAFQKDIEIKHTRGSGPGGQHRNKVNTAVVMRHVPTDVVATASEERSQARNQANALRRLRVRLALACRTEPPPAAPSALWVSRCKGGKLSVNEAHEDFPALLAEALDWVWAGGVKEAAGTLGVSSSQMIKLLAKEPTALQQVNALRASEGLSPLRRT